MSRPKPSLRRKLFLARKAVEPVAKRGLNETEDYWFARYEDVLAEASKQLEKRGILVLPNMAEEEIVLGRSGVLVKTVIEYEVIDTESDESVRIRWAGTGHDSPGDKAIFKGTTGTNKYFLANLLQIPFGTDPEAAPSPQADAPVEAALRLNVGILRERLLAVGHSADRDSLALLLGACGIAVDLPEQEEAVAATELSVTADQFEAVEAEVRRIEQDQTALAVGGADA